MLLEGLITNCPGIKMGQSNCQKMPKNAKKSRNVFSLLSTVRKLLSEVEPYRTINNEVDVAKKCYQVWQKVAKVAKKVLPDVAKSRQRGSKWF